MSEHHDHDHSSHGTRQTEDERYTQATWDERYAASDRIWSGNPNQRLVEQVTGLTPGDAVDIGAGEGADAVWLATHGWKVTAVDVSPVALGKTAAHAAEAGVADQVTTLRHDLISGDPLPGTYDLVSAHFWHPPVDRRGDFATVLGAAVRPGGHLLVVGHHPVDMEGVEDTHGHAELVYTPEDIVALLPASDWEIEVAEAPSRPSTRDEGPRVLTDTVVLAVRR